MIVHKNYNELFNIDNILSAWQKFRLGKTEKYDVIYFQRHLEDNLFSLHHDFLNNAYRHSTYKHFVIFDSKKRDIHKAEVRDRIVHQIIYDYLVEIYEKIFIKDSYSSRIGKGGDRAIETLKYFIKLSKGENENTSILKCDIKKYFGNVNHEILFSFIKREIKDEKILNVIWEIISSFNQDGKGIGIPLGNVTSQIFANIYLNDLDSFVKKKLKARFYIRYNDDFVIIDDNLAKLRVYKEKIKLFISQELKLEIPEEKTSIRKTKWGIDFLGRTLLPNCLLIRNSTKNKIFQRINEKNFQSYFGLLKHCNAYNLRKKLKAILNGFSQEI